MLLVDQRLEDLADHAEMTAVAFELTLDVDEIGGGGVEPLGQQSTEKECDLRMGPEKAFSVLEHEGTDRRRRPDRRGMGTVQQHGHFAEDRTRAIDDGDLSVASQHLDGAFGEDIEPA